MLSYRLGTVNKFKLGANVEPFLTKQTHRCMYVCKSRVIDADFLYLLTSFLTASVIKLTSIST